MGVLGISMMIFAFAALIRLQNDFFDRLGNLGYIPEGWREIQKGKIIISW